MSHQINVGSIHHNLAAYQQAAMETKVDTTQEQFLYMFGIWGELREIDHAWGMGQIPELIEELGDLLWYVALACHISGLQLHDYAPAQRPLSTDAPVIRDVGMRDLWVPASGLAEVLKKYYWQYQERPDVGAHVRPLLMAIQRIALQVCQVDVVTIAQRNRAKLRHQYPDGFQPTPVERTPRVLPLTDNPGWHCVGTYHHVQFVIPTPPSWSEGLFIDPPLDLTSWGESGCDFIDWPLDCDTIPEHPGVYVANVETWVFCPSTKDGVPDSTVRFTHVRPCTLAVGSEHDLTTLLQETVAVFSERFGDGCDDDIPESVRTLWHRIDDALTTPDAMRLQPEDA